LEKLNNTNNLFFLNLLKQEPELYQKTKNDFLEIENLTYQTLEYIKDLKTTLVCTGTLDTVIIEPEVSVPVPTSGNKGSRMAATFYEMLFFTLQLYLPALAVLMGLLVGLDWLWDQRTEK